MAYIYVVSCESGTLYTGIAKDIKKRLSEHVLRKKPSAKYTKSHKVTRLEMLWETENYADAAKLEYRIKHIPRAKKLELLQTPLAVAEFFPELSEIEFSVSEEFVCPVEIEKAIEHEN